MMPQDASSSALDGHKIDYVKGKTAFDMEWNSKDQTFDRDLYAMAAFFQSGAIDVGVLVTRSARSPSAPAVCRPPSRRL
jgi:hypothetical protein